MPPEFGNISTDHIEESLASLADAADVLTKAATALAEAALATVGALSKEIQQVEVQQPASPEESHGINLGRGSDTASEIGNRDRDGPDPMEGTDIDGGDQGGEYPTPVAGPEEPNPRPMSTDATEQAPKDSSLTNPSYHLLVNSEADVLLFVCALIDKRQKVVCYMPCGTPPLKTYKQLIENVTECPVYILNSSASLNQDQAYLDFVKSSGSVLLVPETLLPQFQIGGENSWVIHAGWPSSESNYTAQRETHRGRNNILVACSSDISLYPSGENINNLTEPWPKNGASFRASVSILRSLYESILSEIPLELKTQVYLDWIQFHSVRGPRHVASWSPVTVVQRANDYLLKVMQWGEENTGSANTPLPEVSAGFVTQNGLQAAVQKGILRVESSVSDPPPRPPPSLAPPSPAPVASVSEAPTFSDRDFRPESAPPQIEFQPTTGLTYFQLAEEFDAIPLICFIAGKYNRVVCFVEGQGGLRTYHEVLGRIAGRVVFFPKVLNDNRAVEEAATRFLSAPTASILLLAYGTTHPPSTLARGLIDCCIYWGFNLPLQPARQNRPLINCDNIIMLMLGNQLKGLSGAHELRRHPSTAISLDLSEDSPLALMRRKTKLLLEAPRNIHLVNGLYMNRVFNIAPMPRRLVSAVEVARRVNQYAARALLHGNIGDGSEVFPPVAGRPSLPRSVVDRFDLQRAVDAGLLTIE